jgi:serine/threonine-protein kinase HipA
MAVNLYGTVYFKDALAGTLEQIPDGRFAFTYDPAYLGAGQPQIAHTLFRRFGPHYSHGLHSFFDNLVAEGWLARAQARALGIQGDDRFARLLTFGEDCPGAVSLKDPRPAWAPHLDVGTREEIAALANRASISGVQRKLFAVLSANGFRPAKAGELSTHIAKLPSPDLNEVVELEYLTTVAAAALLPDDVVVELEITEVENVHGPCLLVRRFDRAPTGDKIHFEEFNQLLERPAEARYEGSYGEMAMFILRHQRYHREEDVDRLFRRILVCILLGNNDAHMKNFGLLYTAEGFRLAPFYDVVAAAQYPKYKDSSLALRLGAGKNPLDLASLGPKHLIGMTKSFDLSPNALKLAVADLNRHLPVAIRAIEESAHGSKALKEKLIDFTRKRWNGTFNSIGKQSRKRHGGEGKREV